MEIESFLLSENDWVPNNQRVPVVIYRGALEGDGEEMAGRFEALCEGHGWRPDWQADDGHAGQAMVVAIDGPTRRPDGGIYHIIWSLDRAEGREVKDSKKSSPKAGRCCPSRSRSGFIPPNSDRWPDSRFAASGVGGLGH